MDQQPRIEPQSKPARPSHGDVLQGLIEMATDIAQVVQRQVAIAGVADLPALAAAFDGTARTIRRCIMLAEHLAAPGRAVGHRVAARKRIIREVEDAIDRHATEGEVESLHAEFLERLDAPDLDGEIGDRPVADIIADIRRDLGLDRVPHAHPWKRRTPSDLARLHARAARPAAAMTRVGAMPQAEAGADRPAPGGVPAEVWPPLAKPPAPA